MLCIKSCKQPYRKRNNDFIARKFEITIIGIDILKDSYLSPKKNKTNCLGHWFQQLSMHRI
ncbi:hypothetical protein DsansV1_C08g0086111 [Dioscorea sansibarensis]